ncbi:hypothetical protein FKM82_018421 [Ascaphus truei]
MQERDTGTCRSGTLAHAGAWHPQDWNSLAHRGMYDLPGSVHLPEVQSPGRGSLDENHDSGVREKPSTHLLLCR